MKIDCVYFISVQPKNEEYKDAVLKRFESLEIPHRYSYFIVPAVNGVRIPENQKYKTKFVKKYNTKPKSNRFLFYIQYDLGARR